MIVQLYVDEVLDNKKEKIHCKENRSVLVIRVSGCILENAILKMDKMAELKFFSHHGK